MKQPLRINYQRGSSLIEIVVATGVMALVLTAIVAGLTLSLKTNADSEYRSQATKRAQEAMEVFRRERTLQGWDVFADSWIDGATYCLKDLPAPKTTFTVGECAADDALVISGVEMYREAVVLIDTSNPADPQVEVTVAVTWDSGGSPRDVSLVQGFRRWN